jgi:hypothetical protein
MTHPTVTAWHELVDDFSRDNLAALLHKDCIFYSPVIFKPQPGKQTTIGYLMAAMEMFSKADDFKYVNEFIDEHGAVLEFNAEMDGIFIDGIDMITWNEDGLITEFKVFIRPLKAIDKVRETMLAQLDDMNAVDKLKIKVSRFMSRK